MPQVGLLQGKGDWVLGSFLITTHNFPPIDTIAHLTRPHNHAVCSICTITVHKFKWFFMLGDYQNTVPNVLL